MENWNDIQTDFSCLNSANNDTFEEVPDGQYTCGVSNMTMTRSKSSGMPMIKVSFKIYDGEYANRLMFCNLLVLLSYDPNDSRNAFFTKRCNEFLKSFKVVSEVELTNLSKYAELVDYIANDVMTQPKLYLVQKITNHKGGKAFAEYSVIDGPTMYQPVNASTQSFDAADAAYDAYQAPSVQPDQSEDNIPF